jgi:hypothetical protein
MPRFLLVTCERGTLVPHPYAHSRRYLGKPKPSPRWLPDEQPVLEVVQDDPALRKAHKNPGDKFTIVKEGVHKDIVEAREKLTPAADKPKKGGDK